jgi:AraC family transcriptional regulator
MIVPDHPSFARWYAEGREASYVRVNKSRGGILDLVELARPAGDMPRPALPELVLIQDLSGSCSVRGNSGGGYYNERSVKGALYTAAPNFAHTMSLDASHQIRTLSFSKTHWQNVLDEASEGKLSFDNIQIHRGAFQSPVIQSSLRNLWAQSDLEQGAPSRLLARAAGCEILAELCRLSKAPFTSAKGGLAPRTIWRCKELMRARLSEDISLDELAAEARLSSFHFARMFKQSVGVTPKVYLTQLRMDRACELLEKTDLPITEIAFEVGYSCNSVLARVFIKHQHMNPSDYRRALRAKVCIVGIT